MVFDVFKIGNFGHFLGKINWLRLICGSTYTRVCTVVCETFLRCHWKRDPIHFFGLLLYCRFRSKLHLYSIWPTFYKQLICQFPLAKKLHSETVSTKKAGQNALVQKKAARKMLVKLAPGWKTGIRSTSSLSFASARSVFLISKHKHEEQNM